MDGFMLFMTKMDLSKVLMITVISIYAVFKGRGRALWVIVLAGIAVGLTDQLSSHLLKNVFERVRPCHILPDVHLLARCPSSFSFPSSHAANFSSAATVLIGYVPMSALVVIPLTLIVAASRVSVGVHWPSDAIGGIIVGAISGFVVVLLSRKVRNSWKRGRGPARYRRYGMVPVLHRGYVSACFRLSFSCMGGGSLPGGRGERDGASAWAG